MEGLDNLGKNGIKCIKLHFISYVDINVDSWEY